VTILKNTRVPTIPEIFEVVHKQTVLERITSKYYLVVVHVARKVPVIFNTVLVDFIFCIEAMGVKEIRARRSP